MSKFEYWNGGFSWILTVIDLFSKYLWAIAIKDKTAKSVVAAMDKILKESPPKILQTDNGSEFIANEFQDLLKLHSVKHITSRSYTPQSQGAVERVNGTLKRAISLHFTQYNTKEWKTDLNLFVANYNNTIHGATKQQPKNLVKATDSAEFRKQKVLANKSLSAQAKPFQVTNNRLFGKLLSKSDQVRVLKTAIDSSARKEQLSGIGHKAYNEQWTKEIYTIEQVFRGGKYSKPAYKIKDAKNEVIQQKFYHDEVQKIDVDNLIRTKSKLAHNFAMQNSREAHLKKLHEANKGRQRLTKVEGLASKGNLRPRKVINYKS
jgi:hypothetical protein